MELQRILEILALIVVSLFLLASVDDVLFDFYYYIRGRKKTSHRFRISDLDEEMPKPVAILIAAWKEEEVIAKMLQNTFASLNYPRSFYHIFVGVYKNDKRTYDAIVPLRDEHSNLHVLLNDNDGPTNKADNLNSMLDKIAEFEHKSGIEFSIMIVHDSEDVIHPTSLKLINYLIPEYQVVQLPVFPLQPKPTLRNFFKYFTTGTYADEFAENHLKAMASREAANTFVPSAGVGFAASREVLEAIKKESDFGRVFTKDSLTEDYDLALKMYKMGFKTHYFIEPLERILNSGKIVTEYIASRSMFPNTFRGAVKQKSRWIYGINFQSVRLGELKRMGFFKNFSLYRDWKAKYANLILIPGYVIFVYVILSFFMPLPVLFRMGSLLWWLSVAVSVVALERQLMRGIAVKKIYGWRSVVMSVLLPPLLPFRYVWGNFINFFATTRAWRTRLFGTAKEKKAWAKTEHTYPPPEMLEYYRRKLGDLLLEKDLVSAASLKEIIKVQSEKKLGEILRDEGMVEEDQLIPLLAELMGSGYIDIDKEIVDPQLKKYLPEDLARKHVLMPIMHWRGGLLVAASDLPSASLLSEISQKTGLSIKVTLARQLDIRRAIRKLYTEEEEVKPADKRRIGETLVDKGLVSHDDMIEAFHIQHVTHKKIGQILVEMHLLQKDQLAS